MDLNKNTLMFWIKQICEFMRKQKFQIDPLPNIMIEDGTTHKNDQFDVLISTGGYCPADQSLYLYVDNRHIKDILRSFCHEMVHHHQYLDNPDYMRRIMRVDQDDVANSNELEEIEGEAYLKGNLMFRKFTEWFKKQQLKKH